MFVVVTTGRVYGAWIYYCPLALRFSASVLKDKKKRSANILGKVLVL